MGKQFGKLRLKTAGKTDRRIRLMNEIVNGMKVVKMYTWEKSFGDPLSAVDAQVGKLLFQNCIQGL